MIKFRESSEKKYRVKEVAKATGLSEGAVSGYFSNRKISTKPGLTVEQVYEVCKARRRGYIRWNDVHELGKILFDRYGVEVIEENDEEQTNIFG